MSADDGVGHVVFQQLFFEETRLRVRPVENRLVSEGNILVAIGDEDIADDELRFFAIVLRFEEPDRRSPFTIGEERLVLALEIIRDHRGGAGENRLRRSVIAFELDHLGVFVVLLEVEDVSKIRPTPGID